VVKPGIRATLQVLVCTAFLAVAGVCSAFSFSDEDAKTQAKDDVAAQKIQDLVSVPCRSRLKSQKIMTLIAEQTTNGWDAHQSRYGPHFQAINARLRALGLRTYTQDEIKAQIAQAELDAYFKNDPDAALAASKRLGANYILRGTITTTMGINQVLHINEVVVRLDFTLSSSSGRMLSNVSGHSESYAGTDTLGMALTLVNEQADALVAQLYNDYCRNAGTSN
jgi:hypothetical protein